MTDDAKNSAKAPKLPELLSAKAIPSAERLRVASDLFEFAYTAKKHRLSVLNPQWDEKQLHDETIRLIDAAARR